MGISVVMGIAASGMQAQTKRLSAVANNIANIDTPGYNRLTTRLSSMPTPGGVSVTVGPSSSVLAESSNLDMGSEMLDLIGAQQSFAANASVFETGADMWDVLMSIKRD
jgi:flagellar hook protein FlgE